MEDVIGILKIVPSLLWFLLVAWLLWKYRDPIRKDLIPRLSGFKALGVELSFVQQSMTSAVELAQKTPEWHVEVPSEDRERADG